VIKKKTMEKFVSWQYLMTYFLFVFLMVSIIFSSSYHIITGEEFTHRWDNILTFSIGITVVYLGYS